MSDYFITAGWVSRADRLADWALANWATRTDAFGGYTSDGIYTAKNPLTHHELAGHFRGEKPIGLHDCCPCGQGNRITIDIDAHNAGDDPAMNWEYARRVMDFSRRWGMRPLVEDSDGRGGFKVRYWLSTVHLCGALLGVGRWVIDECGLPPKTEVFPKQESPAEYGSWVRLPGRHQRHPHWSRFFDDGRWLSGGEAAEFLLSRTPQASWFPGAAWGYRRAADVARTERIERSRLVNIAKSLVPRIGGEEQKRPSELFDDEHSWEEVLEPHGWTLRHGRGEVGHWSRPGVSHVSATTDHIPGKLHVFSNEASPFEAGRTYSKFAAYAALNHQGDWATAVKCFMNSGKARKESGE